MNGKWVIMVVMVSGMEGILVLYGSDVMSKLYRNEKYIACNN